MLSSLARRNANLTSLGFLFGQFADSSSIFLVLVELGRWSPFSILSFQMLFYTYLVLQFFVPVEASPRNCACYWIQTLATHSAPLTCKMFALCRCLFLVHYVLKNLLTTSSRKLQVCIHLVLLSAVVFLELLSC